MRTRNGDTALVEIHEYKTLQVNDVTGRWDQMRIGSLAEDSVRNVLYSNAKVVRLVSVPIGHTMYFLLSMSCIILLAWSRLPGSKWFRNVQEGFPVVSPPGHKWPDTDRNRNAPSLLCFSGTVTC